MASKIDTLRLLTATAKWAAGICILCLCLTGCASPRGGLAIKQREFQPQADGFAYTNELVWEYSFDAAGGVTSSRRDPPPTYAQHCFAMAKAARQFFAHAQFRPELPKPPPHDLEWLVRQVLRRSAKTFPVPGERLVIPGYTNLWQLSMEQPEVLKRHCGKAWQAYVQRGNWRLVFPFSRAHQARTALKLETLLITQEPLIVHLVRFPQLTINHAVAVYDAVSRGDSIEFQVYDPNIPGQPVTLTYDRAKRTFYWPRSIYYPGGRVDVYRIYHGLCY
jgi:hypothetical protein